LSQPRFRELNLPSQKDRHLLNFFRRVSSSQECILGETSALGLVYETLSCEGDSRLFVIDHSRPLTALDEGSECCQFRAGCGELSPLSLPRTPSTKGSAKIYYLTLSSLYLVIYGLLPSITASPLYPSPVLSTTSSVVVGFNRACLALKTPKINVKNNRGLWHPPTYNQSLGSVLDLLFIPINAFQRSILQIELWAEAWLLAFAGIATWWLEIARDRGS